MVDEVADFQTEPVQGREPGLEVTNISVMLLLTRGDTPDLHHATLDFARWSKEGFARCISSIESTLSLKIKRKIETVVPTKGMRLSLVHHSVTVWAKDMWSPGVLEQARAVFCQTFHHHARHWFFDVCLVGALEPSIREVGDGVYTFAWKQRVESSTERSVRPADRSEEKVR